jgi:DNA-binding MarR family transcriptional regulator
MPLLMSESDMPGRDRVNHLLWETSLRAYAFSEPVLADMQLSLPSIGALETISEFPGITASELARHVFKTQQAVSQVTGRLERLGYIERSVGRGRGVGLRITKLGSEALAAGIAGEQAVELRLEELLGSDLFEALRAHLQEARDRLTEVTESTPAKLGKLNVPEDERRLSRAARRQRD